MFPVQPTLEETLRKGKLKEYANGCTTIRCIYGMARHWRSTWLGAGDLALPTEGMALGCISNIFSPIRGPSYSSIEWPHTATFL